MQDQEPVPDAVRRIAREQLDRAIHGLTSAGNADDRAAAVHDARRRLKKVRTLVRLLRPALGKKQSRLERRHLRDTSRLLAPARNADALVEVFDRFAAESRWPSDRRHLTAFRTALLDARRVARADLAEGPTIGDVVTRLRAARLRIDAWPEIRDDWSAIGDGVRRSYRRGAKGLRAAMKDPSPERLHAWRRRSKDLWYGLRLLRSVWPQMIGPLADRTHRLTALLGDDHDLAVLRRALLPPSLPEAAGTGLDDAIAARRHVILVEAGPLGRRIYAESDKRFARRVEAYWTIWREEPGRDATTASPRDSGGSVLSISQR